jgi:hypothetical protein
MEPLRSLLRLAAGAGALLLLCLPAAVAVRLGWLGLAGPQAGLERWTVFAVVCLVWTALVMLLLVRVNGLLGYAWQPPERTVSLPRRERRRLAAGLRLVERQRGAPAGGHLRRRP